MDYTWFTQEMLWLAGSWELPAFYTGDNVRSRQWVNPDHVHVERYTDVAVECGCGAIVTKANNSGGHRFFDDPNNHADDCPAEQRVRAIADLLENRRTALVRAALLGLTSRSLASRLNVGKQSVSDIVDRLDINYRRLRDRGHEKRNETIAEMLRRGYTVEQAATVYDLSEKHVTNTIYEKTPYTITGLKP